jgi:hypothetical protein
LIIREIYNEFRAIPKLGTTLAGIASYWVTRYLTWLQVCNELPIDFFLRIEASWANSVDTEGTRKGTVIAEEIVLHRDKTPAAMVAIKDRCVPNLER